jgi:radical SAM-linked protein
LPRAFRRIDVPLYYSSGFHPKPEMTFGPALSLGVSSLEEMVDVKITADIDAAEIAAALSEGSPDGIRFTGGVRLGPEDAGLTRVIDGARYAVAFAKSALGEEHDATWLRERAEELLAATERKVTRRIEGIGKSVDVRAFIRGIAVDTEESRAAIATTGMVGDLITMLVDVEIRGSGAVKIAEVVEVLAGADVPHRAARVQLGTWKDGALATPMDLSAVRRPRPVREAEPDAASDALAETDIAAAPALHEEPPVVVEAAT